MIDLHMHSRYSDDGEFTPSELIEQCAEKGVSIVSVTDHNCVRANEEAAKAAKEKGICGIYQKIIIGKKTGQARCSQRFCLQCRNMQTTLF